MAACWSLLLTLGCHPEPSQIIEGQAKQGTSWVILGRSLLRGNLRSGGANFKLEGDLTQHSGCDENPFFFSPLAIAMPVATLGSYINSLSLSSNHLSSPGLAVTVAGAVAFGASRSRCGQNGQTGD